MKALVYTANEEMTYRDEPEPTPAHGDALIAIESVGICGSDMHAYLGHDERRVPPLILGHEAVGTVLEGSNAGSPIGDSMPVLLVLDTSLLLRKGTSVRPVPLSNFYIDYQRVALRPGEFIEQILLPLPVNGEQVASYKVSKRFDQDISAVCGAYRLIKNGDRVGDIKIAYGGMAATPKRADNCEQALLGKDWSEPAIAEAIAALDKDFRPISDMRSSATYRKSICANLLKRFYNETAGEEGTRVYTYGR